MSRTDIKKVCKVPWLIRLKEFLLKHFDHLCELTNGLEQEKHFSQSGIVIECLLNASSSHSHPNPSLSASAGN
jgi:hypothetical protein